MRHVYVFQTVLAATVTQKDMRNVNEFTIFFSRAALNAKRLSL